MEYVYIKNVKIAKTAALAPLADVGDSAFRIMAKRFGAAYTVSEMISAKGLTFGDRKTAELLEISDSERELNGCYCPCGIQLFGSEPESIAKAVEFALSYKPDIIDINAGCPVNKVVSTGAGSALMKTPSLFGRIMESAVRAAGDVPVTVKIRSGWDEREKNAVQIARNAEACGISAVTVHGRTRMQMYSGKSDLGIIAAVKNAVDIPVIGNGDVADATSCVQMYRQTGCDLVMLGRATFGNPWIFREISNFFETGELTEKPTLRERLQVMKEHIELSARLKGERIAMRESRKQAAWYIKGIHGAAALRARCMMLEKLDDLYNLIEDIILLNS
ncbi:MAG: tRNA dihydrouridine synthase DusB [Oscillospiraceae bacterium]|nr:tRNA dihydrouridine synthase DusB [Oscillospiraceae bacterium]